MYFLLIAGAIYIWFEKPFKQKSKTQQNLINQFKKNKFRKANSK